MSRWKDGKSKVEIKKLSKENGTNNKLLEELGFPELRGTKILNNIHCYQLSKLRLVLFQTIIFIIKTNKLQYKLMYVYTFPDPFTTTTFSIFGYAGCDTYLTYACANFGRE